jgi:hypothetical protein
MPDTPDPERRNFYGRIRGKTLKPVQRRRLAQDLGPLVPAGIRPADNPDRRPLVFAQGRYAALHKSDERADLWPLDIHY